MRLTYSDLRTEHYGALGMLSTTGVPNTDVNIDTNFNLHLGQRYQLVLAKMANYKTVKPYTITTSSGVQTYPFPPGLVTCEGGYITVGSVNYPLQPLNSRWQWEKLNAIMIQASALPQFYFVEPDTFRIWPTPQATYTGQLYYHFRDRNLGVLDATGGTVTVTQGSNIVSIAGGTFTPAMVGRWFTVEDPTVPGQGYWYRIIGYTNSTHITLGAIDGATAVNWTQATASTTSYRIGETPEIPEEGHIILAWGTAADYYGGFRKDEKAFAYYNNMFYTGDPEEKSKDFDNKKIEGGLIGLINSYRDRDNRTIIRRRPKLNPLQTKVFATTLS